MPSIRLDKNEAAQLAANVERISLFLFTLSSWFNGAAGIKDLPSRNKPLAQGKPVKRGAKGKPAKAGVKARKGTRKN